MVSMGGGSVGAGGAPASAGSPATAAGAGTSTVGIGLSLESMRDRTTKTVVTPPPMTRNAIAPIAAIESPPFVALRPGGGAPYAGGDGSAAPNGCAMGAPAAGVGAGYARGAPPSA